MPGVTRGREAFEPEDAVSDNVDVPLGDRGELAPQRVEARPVEPAGARFELRRVDEVRSADLGHVHLEPGMLADEHTGRARVVEVDVGEEQVAEVGEVEPSFGKPRLEVRECTSSGRSRRARGRPGSRARSSR